MSRFVGLRLSRGVHVDVPNMKCRSSLRLVVANGLLFPSGQHVHVLLLKGSASIPVPVFHAVADL
jgi:hypothetical protein